MRYCMSLEWCPFPISCNSVVTLILKRPKQPELKLHLTAALTCIFFKDFLGDVVAKTWHPDFIFDLEKTKMHIRVPKLTFLFYFLKLLFPTSAVAPLTDLCIYLFHFEFNIIIWDNLILIKSKSPDNLHLLSDLNDCGECDSRVLHSGHSYLAKQLLCDLPVCGRVWM